MTYWLMCVWAEERYGFMMGIVGNWKIFMISKIVRTIHPKGENKRTPKRMGVLSEEIMLIIIIIIFRASDRFGYIYITLLLYIYFNTKMDLALALNRKVTPKARLR